MDHRIESFQDHFRNNVCEYRHKPIEEITKEELLATINHLWDYLHNNFDRGPGYKGWGNKQEDSMF